MGKLLDKDKENFIRKNAEDLTVKELVAVTGQTETAVRGFCHKHRIKFKKAYVARREERRRQDIAAGKIWTKAISHKRPPAIYTNRTPFGIASHDNQAL